MNDTAVQIHNVTKTYGTKKALDRLELSIPQNRITAIMGPNGSGKSTLFRLIMGLTMPDQGTIDVLGQFPGWRANAQIVYHAKPNKAIKDRIQIHEIRRYMYAKCRSCTAAVKTLRE